VLNDKINGSDNPTFWSYFFMIRWNPMTKIDDVIGKKIREKLAKNCRAVLSCEYFINLLACISECRIQGDQMSF
jgi:hypothetical protein